jgi:hypothetical protein
MGAAGAIEDSFVVVLWLALSFHANCKVYSHSDYHQSWEDSRPHSGLSPIQTQRVAYDDLAPQEMP